MKNILFIICLLFSVFSQAEVNIPRLSPLPIGIDKNKVDLIGTWNFSDSPTDNFWEQDYIGEWDSIEVPGEWCMQGFNVKKGTEAAYKRTFKIPKSWNGKRIKLRCNGVYSESRIFINGNFIGSHLGGFTSFEYDVTDFVSFDKENMIVIGVKSYGIADSLANASKYAAHDLGGITRDLFLFPLEALNISMFHVSTKFDKYYKNAELCTEIELTNESTKLNDSLFLQFVFKDKVGKEINIGKSKYLVSLKAGEKIKQNIIFNVISPTKWDQEHPYLYEIICKLVDNNLNVLHETSRKVGFRQIEIKGNQLYVNNMPVKLRGICRHEVMPLRGRSVIGDIWEKDIRIFREGNVNYIRTSHYPPHEKLLDICDELGMFVEVEAPFCWAHEVMVKDNDKYKALVNQHIEMVNRDRSHPSVLIWSVGNESHKFNEYFLCAANLIYKIDSTRPRIFSQWEPTSDRNELEIGNHHYPGPIGPDKYRYAKRPIIFDEFCHLNAYNRFELSSDPGLRNMWGEILDKMYTNMYHSKGVLGGAIWSGIDDTFFLPDGKIVGYGAWGVIDGWRRLKPEYWNMKKAYSPVKIFQESNMTINGEVRFFVENRFNFTNLDDINILWKTKNANGCIDIDVAPRSESFFNITLPKEAYNDEMLTLEIKDSNGVLIDKYNFKIQLKEEEEKEERTYGLFLKEYKDTIIISSKYLKYKFNKKNGMIDYSPTLMLLPLNNDGRGTQMTGEDQKFDSYNPTCTRWIAESYKVKENENSVIIDVYGYYKEAKGKFTYSFLSNSVVMIDYNFVIIEPVSPRQIGIVFTLPDDYDVLKWKRKGYWNAYPKNHIGALEGIAKAFDSSLPICGLAGPSIKPNIEWCKDQTESGSNMFRSTKENIYEASLSSSVNDALCWTVVSDGSQSVRAWKENGHVRVLVADYINSGNEKFLIPFVEKEYKNLKKGDVVSGRIILKDCITR